MKKFTFPIVLVVIVGVLIGVYAIGNKGKTRESVDTQTHFDVERIGEEHPDEGASHVSEGTAVEYQTNPPSSGNHYPSPAPWGIKNGELPDETVVHNLEHGGVLITFKPCTDEVTDNCLDEEQERELKSIVRDLPTDPRFNIQKFILMPRSKNTHPVALAAWHYTLNLESIDQAKIEQFYQGHVNRGPELVP